MYLFFVRHGMPDYEHDSITEYGKKEAQAVAKRFSLLGLDKIFSSTMGRAMLTAEYTAKELGLTVEGVDFAREDTAFSEFVTTENGKTRWCFLVKDVISDFLSDDVKKLGNKWYDSPRFSGTKYKSGTLRVKKAVIGFMEKLGYKYDEKTGTYTAVKHVYDRVALFAHEGFFMIFASCLLNLPYPTVTTLFQRMSTSTVTVFNIEDEGENLFFKICSYCNDSHLYKENLLDEMDRRTF